MPSCIFHHPFPVDPGGNSGSRVRPFQMLKAFRQVGLEVEVVTGYAAERKKTIERLARDIAAGRDFDFIYSESHSLPTPLTERHHFPTHPFLDFRFLAHARRNRIPVGLFYRDVHWRFNHYRNAPIRQRVVTHPMYRHEWRQYQKLVDVLFLPSLAMGAHLPSIWPAERVFALPPGAPDVSVVPVSPVDKTVNMLYVGGVTPPLYDLQKLFDYMDGVPVTLTLVCRQADWEAVKALYRLPSPDQIQIIHAEGAELKSFYQRTHVTCAIWNSSRYMDFALPVKVLESLGHCVPMIATSGTEAARFIGANKTGWVVDNQSEFIGVVERILRTPGELTTMQETLKDIRVQHTWQARARTVQSTMRDFRRQRS